MISVITDSKTDSLRSEGHGSASFMANSAGLNGLADDELDDESDDLGTDVTPPPSAFWKASLPAKAAPCQDE
jgi:hypothetical protein